MEFCRRAPGRRCPFGERDSDDGEDHQGQEEVDQQLGAHDAPEPRPNRPVVREDARVLAFLAQANEDDDALVVAEMDLDMIDEVRNIWQFFRDRRPETYEELVDL